MSYAVSAYAVDLALLRGVVAQPHHPARAKLSFDVGTPEGLALAALLGASPPSRVTPSDLGYALQNLCNQLGRSLGGNGLQGIRSAFLESAETAIDSIYAPVGFSLRKLVEGGPPVPIPLDDFPAIGFVEADVVARAHAFTVANDPTHPDPDIDQVLVDLAEWLAVASSLHCGLVAFYA